MITDVVIEDYQSIRKARLNLGRLTVVTGPSSSGKSAVLRAMRLVAFNARGTSYIRHGAKLCQAALGFRDENMVVSIRRGGRGRDAYRMVWREGPGPNGQNGVELTKLAGEVPSEVREVLQLQDINFAGQLDMPFLLAESGSQVARVLGELTNVTLVLDAAREANRRKLEVARELRLAEKALASLTEQAQAFTTLRERRQASAAANEHLQLARDAESRRARLLALLHTQQAERRLLNDAVQQLAVLEAPSAGGLDSLSSRRARLLELRDQYQNAYQAARAQAGAMETFARAEEQAHAELHSALVTAGTCPTCGSEIR